MPSVALVPETPAKSRIARKPRPPTPPLPLPPPIVAPGTKASRRSLVIDLRQPLGLSLTEDCSVRQVYPGSQADVPGGISRGCCVNVVDGEVVSELMKLKAVMRACRARGETEIELEYRPPKPCVPLRPFLYMSLRELEAPETLQSEQRNIMKPVPQKTYEEGMVLFRTALKRVERGDFSWDTLPPGTARDLENSRDTITSAARRGWPHAMNHLGMLAATGTHPSPLNVEDAVMWWEAACESEDNLGISCGDACYNLANAMMDDVGIAPDHARGVSLLERAATHGHALAQSLLGDMCARGDGGKTNAKRAVELWKAASGNGKGGGEPEAQFSLGKAFMSGSGLSNTNPHLAVKLWEDAARSSAHPGALSGVGFVALQSAADDGIADTSAANGTMNSADEAMHDGVMEEANNRHLALISGALLPTAAAAKSGHPPAMHNLAVHYRDGLGVPRDLSLAYAWALAAAHKQYPPAQLLVGLALQEGWAPDEVAANEKLEAYRATDQGSAWLEECQARAATARGKESAWLENEKAVVLATRKETEARWLEEAEEARNRRAQKEALASKVASAQAALVAIRAKGESDLEEAKVNEVARQAREVEEAIDEERLEYEQKMAEQRLAWERARAEKEEAKEREQMAAQESEQREIIAKQDEARERSHMSLQDQDVGYTSEYLRLCGDKGAQQAARLRYAFHAADPTRSRELPWASLPQVLSYGVEPPHKHEEVLPESDGEKIGATANVPLQAPPPLLMSKDEGGDVTQLQGGWCSTAACNQMLEIERKHFRKEGFCQLDELRALAQVASLAATFSLVDLDGGGSISPPELHALLEKLGHELSKHQMMDLFRAINRSKSSQISFADFVEYFRHTNIEERLAAEVNVIRSKEPLTFVLDLTKPLGMVINPDGAISSVKGQALALGLEAGCHVLALNDTSTPTLDVFKAAIASAKSEGDEDATLSVRNVKRDAESAAHLSRLKAEASRVAAIASAQRHAAAEKSRNVSAKAAIAVAQESAAARTRAEDEATNRRLQRAFFKADRNHTGLVPLDEEEDEEEENSHGKCSTIRDVVTAAADAPLSDQQWSEVLAHGIDGDFLVRPTALTLSGATELVEIARLCLEFAAVDEDSGGTITVKELGAVLKTSGHDLSTSQLKALFAQLDPSGDGEVSLGEFLEFFRHTPVHARLDAEIAVLQSKEPLQGTLKLDMPLGMVVNPNGQVSKVTPGKQAALLGLEPGCTIFAFNETPTTTLAALKRAIASSKSQGEVKASLKWQDPKRAVTAAAHLARLKSEASQRAATIAAETEAAAAAAHATAQAAANELAEANERARAKTEARRQRRKEAAAQAREEAKAKRKEMELALQSAVRNAENAAREAKEAEDIAQGDAEVAAAARARAAHVREEAERFRKAEFAQLRQDTVRAEAAVHAAVAKDVALCKALEAVQATCRLEGIGWWRLGAERNHAESQHLLADALARGTGGCPQDGKEASKWWSKAIETGYAPAQHGFAVAYIEQLRGVALRPGAGVPGNLERATELLVLAARQDYAPAQDFLFDAQPLSYATLEDFVPTPLPRFSFADSMLGRRVEVCHDVKDSKWRGRCGNVRAAMPARSKYLVEFDDGSQHEFRTRQLQRHFLAPLDDSFVRVPPLPPIEIECVFAPERAMGLEADFATLLVTRVLPEGQAWDLGVRPGCTLVKVGGEKVATLDDAAGAYEAGRLRGDPECAVVFLVEQEAKWTVF